MDTLSSGQSDCRATAVVVRFDPCYIPAYVALNREWIEHHFVIEPMDLKQLENPRERILDIGGEIFFVIEGGEAVGVCAMLPEGEGTYELAKMAVAPIKKGRGYGDLLMGAALDWAREKKARRVVLLSNTKLEPAIALYKKHGFKTIHLGPHPHYERCNIEMEFVIQP